MSHALINPTFVTYISYLKSYMSIKDRHAIYLQAVFDGVDPQCTTDALLMYQKKYNQQENIAEEISDENIANAVCDLMAAGKIRLRTFKRGKMVLLKNGQVGSKMKCGHEKCRPGLKSHFSSKPSCMSWFKTLLMDI